MNTEKFGTFIAQYRKENQMTQAQLAEKLYVTEKAVSRWECGRGFPDINTLEPLAEALGVSVPELMSSEKAEKPPFMLSIKITARRIHLLIIIALVVWFFYMVPLNRGLRVPFPSAGYEHYDGETLLLLLHQNSDFIMRETAVAVFHQYAVGWGGPIHQKWLWSAMIVTMSGFLWASVICFVCVPKGFRLKEGNLLEHMTFSAVLASVSLLQILQSLRSDPEDFFWVPWFVCVLMALAVRAYARIHSGKRTVRREAMFHAPWIVGLVIPHLIWFEPFRGMNYGTPIELPISCYPTNSYTIMMNIAVVVISLGFVREILLEKRKENIP